MPESRIHLVKLIDVAIPRNRSVKTFSGERVYIATGDLLGNQVNPDSAEVVDFESKPSRASQETNPGDVIFAKMQATDKSLIIDEDGSKHIYSSGFFILEPTEKILPDYLYHFLRSKSFHTQKDKNCSGATQKAITLEWLQNIKIPLPSLEEQKSIVVKLTKLTELISLKSEAIKKTEELIKSVFLEMFGSDNKDFPDWNFHTIEDLLVPTKWAIRSGPFWSDLLHSEFTDSGVYVLWIDNVVNNQFEWWKERYISNEKYQWLKRYTVSPGDVLISIMATIWRSAVVPDNIPLAINSKHLATITLNKEYILPEFLAFSFHSNPDILDQIRKNERWAIMEWLNLGIIKSIQIKLPPLGKQELFCKILRKNQHITEQQKQSLQKLQELYDTTVQEIFSFSQGPVLSVLENNPKQIKIFIKSCDTEWFFWKIQALPEWWVCFYPPKEIEVFFFWNGKAYPWPKDIDHITFHNSGRVHIGKREVIFDYWKFKEDENKIRLSKRESLWNHFPQLLFKVRVLDIQSLPKKEDIHTRRDGDIILEQDNNSLYFTCGIFDVKSLLDAINWVNDPFWLRLIGTYRNTCMYGLWEFEDCSGQEKDGTKILYLVARDYQASDFEDQIKDYWYIVSVSEFNEIWSTPY